MPMMGMMRQMTEMMEARGGPHTPLLCSSGVLFARKMMPSALTIGGRRGGSPVPTAS